MNNNKVMSKNLIAGLTCVALFNMLLIGSCDFDDNPAIRVIINVPFTLKNTDSVAIPKGFEDVAEFIDTGGRSHWRLELIGVVDQRCSSCFEKSTDFFVKLLLQMAATGDTSSFYLGSV